MLKIKNKGNKQAEYAFPPKAIELPINGRQQRIVCGGEVGEGPSMCGQPERYAMLVSHAYQDIIARVEILCQETDNKIANFSLNLNTNTRKYKCEWNYNATHTEQRNGYCSQ